MTHTIDLASIVKNFGNEGKIVGFANKYYTLWTYKITECNVNHELVFDAYFVKNIGLTNPYAGVCPFDEGLKGVEIHITSYRADTGLQLTPQEFKALRFSIGNEKGLLISECNSLESLIWKYNSWFVNKTITEERRVAERTNIGNRAIELGAIEINGMLYSTEMQQKDWFIAEKELLNKLDNNQPAIIEVKHNLNGNGCYDTLFVNLHFDNRYYPCTYYGPAYCLPLDKKGHGKRIKGTNICIIKAEKIDDKNYKVIDWEIIK